MNTNPLLWLDVPGISERLCVADIKDIVVKPYTNTVTVVLIDGKMVEIKRGNDGEAQLTATEIHFWKNRMKNLFPEAFAAEEGGSK